MQWWQWLGLGGIAWAVLLIALLAAAERHRFHEYKRQLDERNDRINAHYQANLEKFRRLTPTGEK